MVIRKVDNGKKAYLSLLLLADESESMIDKYLSRGDMFVMEDDGVVAECVVTNEHGGVYELKNIAVTPKHQRRGCGKALIAYICDYYADCSELVVGTGDADSADAFYTSCGFRQSHRIRNFFTDNYDHPMFEDGKQLIDMVYYTKHIQGGKQNG